MKDAVVHVSDISNPDWAAQDEEVRETLARLGFDKEQMHHVITVHNKVSPVRFLFCILAGFFSDLSDSDLSDSHSLHRKRTGVLSKLETLYENRCKCSDTIFMCKSFGILVKVLYILSNIWSLQLVILKEPLSFLMNLIFRDSFSTANRVFKKYPFGVLGTVLEESLLTIKRENLIVLNCSVIYAM